MVIRFFRLLAFALFFVINYASAQKPGVFEKSTDVGAVLHKGSVQFNPSAQQYTITRSGANIWGTHDEFHYAWRKLKGNFILQTRPAFIGKGVEPHRKIGWMALTNLDTFRLSTYRHA